MARTMKAVLYLAVWGICLYLTFFMGVFPGDVIADKAVAQAVVDNGDPYRPLDEIGNADGFWSAPRLPAALLIMTPLVLIPETPLIIGITILNVTAVVAVVFLSLRLAGISERWLIVTPLLLLTAPGLQAVRSTNVAPLVGLAVVMTWSMVARGDSLVAGLPLALAASLKLFPLWIAFALIVGGRRRAGSTALAVFVGLNLVGLLVPAVTVDGTIAVLGQETFYSWAANISLAALADPYIPAPITAAFVLVCLLAWLVISKPRWELGIVAAPLALLAGPLTWPMYLMAVGPLIPGPAFLPIVSLWFLPVFGVPQKWPLAISVVVIVVTRWYSVRESGSLTVASPEPRDAPAVRARELIPRLPAT